MVNANRQLHIGEKNRANNGMMMTIIGGESSEDLTIQFEDGVVVKHKYYCAFKKGKIGHPNRPTANRSQIPNTERIGETNTSYYGEQVTIIGYRGCEDVDVKFADGTIVRHTKYVYFQKGRLKNPNYFKNRRLGESHKASNGLIMTIIEYRNSMDIDVKFEDGVVVQHRTYFNFLKGEIRHPQYSHSYCQIKNRTGEKYRSANGMMMTIIASDKYDNMTVQFEDGYISEHNRFDAIRKGLIKHPFPYKIGNIVMKKPAYTFKDEGNYFCKCSKCGMSDVMSLKEIKEHICLSDLRR